MTARVLPAHPHHGFTLVELSIVLVILGLLVGGVLTGQSLIRAAELRSVTTQFNNYVTAANTFRDKYFAIPGDMTNATSFWGTAHATPATCVTTVGTGTQTCNGNGDGQIFPSTGSHETYRFWQHLVNAGLIEGNYTGVQGGGMWYSTTANSPAGKISGTLWFAHYWAPQSSGSSVFDGIYNNFLLFGAAVVGDYPYGGALKPEEAWNIDTKTDDGKPATGRLVVNTNGNFAACTDASASSTLTANYLLSATGKTCALMFRQLF